MKTVKLTCENCGAILDVKDNVAFCLYCGAKLVIDDGNKTFTHNYNYTKRDEAHILECETKEKIRLAELDHKERTEIRTIKGIIIGFGIAIFIITAIPLGFGINKWISKSKGKISAGYHYDYIDENYDIVIKQFEEMGFENIVAIDLNDSGLSFWNDNKVKSVTINGDNDFGEFNYFYPNDKVIIKYH